MRRHKIFPNRTSALHHAWLNVKMATRKSGGISMQVCLERWVWDGYRAAREMILNRHFSDSFEFASLRWQSESEEGREHSRFQIFRQDLLYSLKGSLRQSIAAFKEQWNIQAHQTYHALRHLAKCDWRSTGWLGHIGRLDMNSCVFVRVKHYFRRWNTEAGTLCTVTK